ncbi:glycosyltransferase family 4 protein [Psychroserpens sp. S379A]|uniref:glycosyltransferase family 4 protein n=1 Tax=Psychroserpens sp. S379A TaxID=3415137 RepID=UPI003C7A28D3
MNSLLKILWLSPNFNHYKARFLNHLAADTDIQLTILSGSGRLNVGDQELTNDWNFEHIKLNVLKKDYGRSKLVKGKLKAIFDDYDWIMIPAEKKNLPLFLYTLKLRRLNKEVRLFSYNHPVLRSGNGKITVFDKWITKFYFRKLNRVVFYTEHSCQWALKNGLVRNNKAYWANNTVDNIEIKKHYTYQLPPENSNTIVFIGRLIPSKRVPDLITYFTALKKETPNIKLEIIGDGPESYHIKSALQSNTNIVWHGTLIDEASISPIMTRAALVFIPGHSGLSVNHAFSYGRPYVTLKGPSHAPELQYLEEGKTGYILEGDFKSNVNTIKNLLSNREVLERFCTNAQQKGEYLSVQKWVEQMKQNLLSD